jgi:glycosyltransferase involved in cell wall biosynthesis
LRFTLLGSTKTTKICMKVSIITAVYNNASYIQDAIESVLAQDYDNLEYIVIDGGSTDGTLDLVRKYRNHISVIVSEPDKGLYDALNKGVKMATGDIIGFLHADDVYANQHTISRMVETFNLQGCDTAYSDLLYVDAANTDKVIRYWQADTYSSGSFLKGWMPPHPTFFVKREIYQRYGTYNTDMRISADYELMLRLLHRYQVSTAYLPEITVKMRVGGVSNASLLSRWRANMEDRLAWKVNNLKPYFYTLYAKPFSKLAQYFKKPPVGTQKHEDLATV